MTRKALAKRNRGVDSRSNPADNVQKWPLERLVPYLRNARTHSDEQVEQLAASIRQWGWTVPVLVTPDGVIIAGHGRVLAAKKLGITEVPVMVADGWTDAQVRAYVLADNRLAQNAGWDVDLLELELAEMSEMGFDMKLAGFDDEELARALGTTVRADKDPDEVPPAPVVPVSKHGDVWVMGSHRIMVGDCRDVEHVDRLLDGRKLNLAFTSPPYAEQRDYDAASGFRPIPSAEYVEWFAPVAANVAAALAPDGSWFVNIKPPGIGLDTDLYVFDLVIAHVRQWGWHFATEFCWERNGVPKSVTQRFKNQFEPVYQFTRGRWKMRPDAVRHESDNVPMAGGKGVGDTSWKTAQGGNGPTFGAQKKKRKGGHPSNENRQGTDWQSQSGPLGYDEEHIGPGLAYPGNRLPTFTSSHQALGHAAAFPVGLPEFFIRAYTDAGDAVFDPFVGSGSSVMAAERTGRDGYAMDISPQYVDVAVLRWQQYTGEEATLEGAGQTFAQVSNARKKTKARAA